MLRRYGILIVYWLIAFAISCLISFSRNVNYTIFTNLSFIFTFIGVLIGFSLTLFTHIVGLIDRLKTKYENLLEEESKSKKINQLNELYNEIKDDINFQFFSLIIVVLTYLFSSPIKQFVTLEFGLVEQWLLPTIVKLKGGFLLSVFMLTLLSMKDLISVSFKLSRHVVIDRK